MSFTWQPLLIVVVFAALRQERRMWAFITAATSALIVTSLLFALMPAQGVYLHYGVAGLKGSVPVNSYGFDQVMTYLRTGGRELTLARLTGLVSFPSYHTTVGVLCAWAAWPVKWLRWPLLLINIGLVVAVPVVGAHYLTDVLGGIAVAAASAWLAVKLVPQAEPASAL